MSLHVVTAESASVSASRVILVHGALDRHNAFRRVARRVEDQHVVMYDRRGYGKSVHLESPDGLEAHVADLLGVLDEQPAVIVGHSVGSLVALGAAAIRPDLCLAVGAFEPPTPWKPWWPRFASDPDRYAEPEVVVEWFYRKMVGDAAWERLSDRMRSSVVAEGPALITDVLVGRDGPVFQTDQIDVPVLLGHGGHAMPRHERAAEELQAELPDAALMVIPDAGHGAHRSHPTAFAGFIEATVARQR